MRQEEVTSDKGKQLTDDTDSGITNKTDSFEERTSLKSLNKNTAVISRKTTADEDL